MNRYLFIGGHSDGKLIVVDERQYIVQMPVVEPMSLDVRNISMADISTIRYECYRQMKFHGEKEIFTVYALDGLKANDVMCWLINNYRPEAKNGTS